MASLIVNTIKSGHDVFADRSLFTNQEMTALTRAFAGIEVAGNVAATFTGALGSAFVGKVITPIATSKNEAIVSKAEVTNTKPDINVYPLQTPVKADNILVNPKTGLKEVRPQETILDTHAKLNKPDQGKLKPAEAATGAQLESVLG